jgi:excisionase family DNA binding protein
LEFDPMPLTDDRIAYRVATAVVACDIPRSKIYKLIAAGELPVVHVGRTTLILADDLRAFLERRRETRGNGNGNGGEPISTAPEQPRSRPPPPKKRRK